MRYAPILASLPLALLVLLAEARGAHAESVDDATRSAARALGEQGIALYDAGDFAGALAAFERADALVHVPTLSLRAARCLEKLGRWVEASERYLTTTALTVSASLPESYQEAQRQAQTEAARARAALTPRIPSLEIVVEGPLPYEVLLDGRVVPNAALGMKRPVDPGEHTLRATRGTAVVEQRATLAEGTSARFALVLPEAPPPPKVTQEPVPPTKDTLRTAGWVGVGTGAAALAAGFVTWGVALAKQSDLDPVCPDGVCQSETLGEQGRSDLALHDATQTTSTVCFVGGSLLLAAGTVTLWVSADGPNSAAPAEVSLRVGPAGAALAGRF